jgi:hypothetical protein
VQIQGSAVAGAYQREAVETDLDLGDLADPVAAALTQLGGGYAS